MYIVVNMLGKKKPILVEIMYLLSWNVHNSVQFEHFFWGLCEDGKLCYQVRLYQGYLKYLVTYLFMWTTSFFNNSKLRLSLSNLLLLVSSLNNFQLHVCSIVKIEDAHV